MGPAGQDPNGPPRPVRRTYTPRPQGRSRDVDAFERVARFRVLGWSIVGAFLGFLLGVFVTLQGEGGALVIVATTLMGWAGAYFGPLLIMKGAGRAGSVLYSPSGNSTPHKREYSLAESYAVRGQYDQAIAAFEGAIEEDPRDSLPYLRVARLQRDKLSDHAQAERWFKRALFESELTDGTRLLACKELVELYEVRMGEPRRAAPLLARVAEEARGTRAGDWAAGELARIKAEMAERPDDA